MKRWRVTGAVNASKYLGEYEAETAVEACEKAIEAEGYVSMCNQCSSQCEDGEVVSAEAEEIE